MIICTNIMFKRIFIFDIQENHHNAYRRFFAKHDDYIVTISSQLTMINDVDTYFIRLTGDTIDYGLEQQILKIALLKKVIIFSNSNSTEFGFKMGRLNVDVLVHIDLINESTLNLLLSII